MEVDKNECKACLALQVKGCLEVISVPNKEVVAVPRKDVVLVPGDDKKQVVSLPNRDMVAVPGDKCKQVATVPKKDVALIPAPKLDVCVNFRLPSACFTCNLNKLPRKLKEYVEEKARICQPDAIHLCDGSETENLGLLRLLEKEGRIQKLDHMENCWLSCTDPKDVARVESRTFISTTKQIETVPTPKHGFNMPASSINLPKLRCSPLGNWMSLEDADVEVKKRFTGCMKGRIMYIIPYSMGPVGGPISKIGVELTDSPYVVCSMRIMTRMGDEVFKQMHNETSFVKCLHSVGVPLPTTRTIVNNWPCNPEMTMIAHFPENNEVISYGSGYGGNSLLGKKCFALRLGSILGKREGWLAEHMLIMGLTNPQGEKKYIAAAFPSQCGKTNLAMLKPSMPGWKVECVGDDIAWMKFNEKGELRAINPERGFFGVCPGTNDKSNPNALKTIKHNTIFTNVAHTDDGSVYWEGLDDNMVAHGEHLHSWKNKDWTKESKEPAAHPNSRFCAPAEQCPSIDPDWESPEGVPISAIVFGGRRPTGVPLVYESFDWNHGVFLGGTLRSETTSAAEFTGKKLMHDPMSMRPFLGYNFGDYLKHWCSMNKPERKMPKVFMVNWFRRAEEGKGSFLWPGFGENIRVLEWIFNRCDNNQEIAEMTPIGYIPKANALDLKDLNISKDQMDELFKIDKKFLQEEADEIKEFLDENVNESTPKEIYQQLDFLNERIKTMADWEFV